MRQKWLSSLAAIMFCSCIVDAQVPRKINYQGYLTAPNGAAVDNASVAMVFRIYDAPTIGSALHTEAQSVVVSNGIFNVVLVVLSVLWTTMVYLIFITEILVIVKIK